MIRGDDTSAFTRKRKVSTLQIVMQTLTQRGKTQRCEIRELSKSLGKNWVKDITDVGFYKARMKFNPNAMKAIADAYLDEERTPASVKHKEGTVRNRNKRKRAI